jgi:pimeloyl-ACP methyl ester carboxylesterase
VHDDRDLLSLLDALDLDQITVAGHSHGGYVALFAASRSEKIRRSRPST